MPSAVSRRNMGEPRYRWWWHFQRIVWTQIGFISLWKVGNVTSTTETSSWNLEAEMAARSEIWQVLSNIWSTRNANLSDVNEWSCFKGENAGNPRSDCCLCNLPAASWLCRSHWIPPQVDLRFLIFVFILVWLSTKIFVPGNYAMILNQMMIRWITPLTITPAVSMIGVSLFEAASYNAQGNWGVAIL